MAKLSLRWHGLQHVTHMTTTSESLVMAGISCSYQLQVLSSPHTRVNPPPHAHRALAMSAGSSATSASCSTALPSEVLPSIDEFRTWSPEQVVEFLEPYITMFSKDERNTFLDGRYDGETLESMTHHDLAEDGLPKGPSRKITAVVNKIRNNINTKLKRKSASCESDMGNTDKIQVKLPCNRAYHHQSDTRGRKMCLAGRLRE